MGQEKSVVLNYFLPLITMERIEGEKMKQHHSWHPVNYSPYFNPYQWPTSDDCFEEKHFILFCKNLIDVSGGGVKGKKFEIPGGQNLPLLSFQGDWWLVIHPQNENVYMYEVTTALLSKGWSSLATELESES